MASAPRRRTFTGSSATSFFHGKGHPAEQWVFPAPRIYVDHVTCQRCRHHLHGSVLQRAVKDVVRGAAIAKPATCHPFRYSFAAHLLEEGHDIGAVQELPGHRDAAPR